MKILSRLEKSKDYWFIFVTSFIFFVLRLPSLFEPYWYGDEGIYQVVGMAIRHGRLLYRDIWDNKPPLLYLLYALFNSDQFTIRLVSLIFGIFSVIVLFFLAKKLFGQLKTAQKIVFFATSFFALFLSLPLLEGNIANSENFMLLPILISAFLVFKTASLLPHANMRLKRNNSFIINLFLFASGFSLGLAFLLKVVAVFDFAAFLLFILFLSLPRAILQKGNLVKYVKTQGVPSLLYIVGFVIPIAATSIFFLANGAFLDFVRATFIQNIGYVGYGNRFIIPQGLLVLKLIILVAFVILVFTKRDKLSKTTLFIWLWFGFSLFNAFFSERPYTHYLLVLLPSFSLLLGALFIKDKKYQKISLILLVASLTLIIVNFRTFGKTIGYYQNFVGFVTGKIKVSAYQSFFDKQTPIDYELAQFINLHSNKEDGIFIWGNNAQVYKLTDKLPPGKYIVAYHITGYKDGIENTQAALKRYKPKFIVVMSNQSVIPFSLSHYKEAIGINNALIYERAF